MRPNFLQKHISGVKITISHHWRRAFSHFAANISAIVSRQLLSNQQFASTWTNFYNQSNGQTDKNVVQTRLFRFGKDSLLV